MLPWNCLPGEYYTCPNGNIVQACYSEQGILYIDHRGGTHDSLPEACGPPSQPKEPEPPKPPPEPKSGGGSGGGAERLPGSQGGATGFGGMVAGGGGSSGGGASAAEPAVPDWMKSRFDYWDKQQKQYWEQTLPAYAKWSGQKFEESWKNVGELGKAAAWELQHKYGAALGALAQGQSQQQSALAKYAATGRMTSGGAEQALTGYARESAKGALGAYQSYAGGLAAVGDSMMKAYTALGAEAGKYTQMALEAAKAMPNPYEDWANFMSGLGNYAQVAA